MNITNIFSRAFSFICLLGFLLQVQQVSELYFRFETTSRTVFQILDLDRYQSIVYCPQSLDLVDRKNYTSYGILGHIPNSLEEVLYELERLTIKDILELTPHESTLIRGCQVRQGRVSTPVEMNRKECEAFFKVMKSVHGERICYTFIPNVPENYSAETIASSLTHTMAVYQIFIQENISNCTQAYVISTVMDGNNTEKYALHSQQFQAFIENKNTFNQSRLTIHGDPIEINRLPPPHDTKCTPSHDREKCYESCLTERFKAINRVPWSGFHREKLHFKILITTDLMNETISMFVDKAFDKCHSLCKTKTECLTQFSRTTVQEFQAGSFVLASMIPSFPHISLQAVPCLNLIEFIVQIGSSFGMWFGLSIISCNPLKWGKQILSKNFIHPRNNNRFRRLFPNRERLLANN